MDSDLLAKLLLKQLTESPSATNTSELIQLLSKQLSDSSSSLTTSSPDLVRPPATVQASEESIPVPAHVESPYTPVYAHSAQSHASSASPASKPPKRTQNYGHPMGTLKIKTGAGGYAEGGLAIGGDAGDVGYNERRSKIDFAALASASRAGPIKAAVAGHGGRTRVPNTLAQFQRQFSNVTIETGVGGRAKSPASTFEYYPPSLVTEPADDQDDSDDPDDSEATMDVPVHPEQY